jgi:hypothetical protein
MTMTDDELIYLGKVSEWIKACPDGKLDYGEFYVSKIEVTFDGQLIGTFISDDPAWLYEEHNDK